MQKVTTGVLAWKVGCELNHNREHNYFRNSRTVHEDSWIRRSLCLKPTGIHHVFGSPAFRTIQNILWLKKWINETKSSNWNTAVVARWFPGSLPADAKRPPCFWTPHVGENIPCETLINKKWKVQTVFSSNAFRANLTLRIASLEIRVLSVKFTWPIILKSSPHGSSAKSREISGRFCNSPEDFTI